MIIEAFDQILLETHVFILFFFPFFLYNRCVKCVMIFFFFQYRKKKKWAEKKKNDDDDINFFFLSLEYIFL